MIGRFSTSRSVRSILEINGENLSESELRELIKEIDTAMIEEYQSRMHKPEGRSFQEVVQCNDNCTRDIAQFLRCYTWQMETTDVTMPAPHEVCIITEMSKCPSFGDSILHKVDPYSSLEIIRGGRKPYIGSTTEKITKRSSLEIMTTNSVITSLKKLIQLQPWIMNDLNNISLLLQGERKNRHPIG
ncbi:Uncharacterised protein at_DN2623 [Pycnogonum litorale]